MQPEVPIALIPRLWNHLIIPLTNTESWNEPSRLPADLNNLRAVQKVVTRVRFEIGTQRPYLQDRIRRAPNPLLWILFFLPTSNDTSARDKTLLTTGNDSLAFRTISESESFLYRSCD